MGFYWFDDAGAGSEPHLAVLASLPADGFEIRPGGYEFVAESRATSAGRKPYHHCWRCQGFVEGHPGERGENSLAPLSGRYGTSYHCRRCGWELAFNGMMS